VVNTFSQKTWNNQKFNSAVLKLESRQGILSETGEKEFTEDAAVNLQEVSWVPDIVCSVNHKQKGRARMASEFTIKLSFPDPIDIELLRFGVSLQKEMLAC
jgi:hypothetical protein